LIEIVFVRHGQTKYNVQGVLQGHLNAPLNEKGLADAKALGLILRDFSFDKLFTSDLNRAKDCAKVISEATGKIFVEDSLLRERNFGVHQEKSVVSLGYKDHTYPELVKHLYNCNCPGGENNEGLLRRVEVFLEMCLRDYDGKRVLVVGHGGFIMLALNYILNEPYIYENGRKHSNLSGSFVKLNSDREVIDSLINVSAGEIVGYLSK
jgi:broad specificity phosphatase PhoE